MPEMRRWFMEENVKRSHTKSRQELFKEFVSPKIIELLENMRAEDAEYQKVVKNEFSYSEQKKLLERLSQSNKFKQKVDVWKKQFDDQYPSDAMKNTKKKIKNLETALGLKQNDNIEIEFF
jgi:hypothetical protein